ncbi:MAG TPA: sensor histidine kinase [Flavisolibacter sp.]|nr:sensor histidine kinase [Flavisolibacter sp.]
MNGSRTLGFLHSLFGFKKANTKRRLLLVILTHLAAWLLLFTLPLLLFPIRIADKAFFVKELVNKSFLIGFFYLNYFWLIPRFFIRQKRVAYFTLLSGLILLLLVQHIIVEKSFMGRVMLLAPPNPGTVMGPALLLSDSLPPAPHLTASGQPLIKHLGNNNLIFLPERMLFIVLINVLSSTIFMVVLGGFIHLSFFVIKSQDEKRALENASLTAEIRSLKSQINPHFLFNTLNSIYSQVYHKSDNAGLSILKLSDILRYVIYETVTDKIDLERDIHYLSSYIDLQRLRLADKVKIDYTVKGGMTGLSIAPLLLITFIENAFKHGVSYTNASSIRIAIEVFDKTLTMMVSNPVFSEDKFGNQGVGLANATRRLELMYPGNYWLDIENNSLLYVVNLKINLHRDQLSAY